jgi:hypothetical protein
MFYTHLRIATIACYLVSALCIVHSWFRQHNHTVLSSHAQYQCVREQQGYATEIMNERHTKADTIKHATVAILRLSKIRWTIQEPRISQVHVRCITFEWVTDRFATCHTRTHSTPIM